MSQPSTMAGCSWTLLTIIFARDAGGFGAVQRDHAGPLRHVAADVRCSYGLAVRGPSSPHPRDIFDAAIPICRARRHRPMAASPELVPPGLAGDDDDDRPQGTPESGCEVSYA